MPKVPQVTFTFTPVDPYKNPHFQSFSTQAIPLTDIAGDLEDYTEEAEEKLEKDAFYEGHSFPKRSNGPDCQMTPGWQDNIELMATTYWQDANEGLLDAYFSAAPPPCDIDMDAFCDEIPKALSFAFQKAYNLNLPTKGCTASPYGLETEIHPDHNHDAQTRMLYVGHEKLQSLLTKANNASVLVSHPPTEPDIPVTALFIQENLPSVAFHITYTIEWNTP